MALSLGAQVQHFSPRCTVKLHFGTTTLPNTFYFAVQLLIMLIFRKLSEKKWLSVVKKVLFLDCVIVCLDHRNYSVQYMLFRQTSCSLMRPVCTFFLYLKPDTWHPLKTVFIPCLPTSFEDILSILFSLQVTVSSSALFPVCSHQ